MNDTRSRPYIWHSVAIVAIIVLILFGLIPRIEKLERFTWNIRGSAGANPQETTK